MKKVKVICLSIGMFLLVSTMLFSVAYATESEDLDVHGLIMGNESADEMDSIGVWGESDIDLVPIGNLICDADWTITCTVGYWVTSANVVIAWNDGPIQKDKITNGRTPVAYGSVQRSFGSSRVVTATLTGTCLLEWEYTGVLTPVSESTYVF
ncbi:hypothetical protein LY28_02204 [Ruminiclostridium sufflavum DSM 19573]|uniref:Uncharacterized protein n=1 Tax=Ruminiclostridium sufflavum DSM 19573 TaxID=1121337 RepID=A0A318XJW8_9FIRM|nr:hypothetical protein [Ruminiclostridium sufflavum]PYG87299.1 hypothetical protein LY28_02204 [Ruminiclostridium sufflavum DSM 19573]